MATLNTGAVTVECPVCKKPWVFAITGRMLPKRGKIGRATVTLKIKKPLRVPREHRDCVSQVD